MTVGQNYLNSQPPWSTFLPLSPRQHIMPKAASSRTPLPALSSDFALPSSTASPLSASSDDHPFLYNRFRRPSLLQKAGYLSESRLLSPLATSFTFHARRRSQTVDLEAENERDRMLTDSSSSSETHTPPLKIEGSEEDVSTAKPLLKPPPLTPPRRKSSMDVAEMPTVFNRRLSFPLKQPRVLTLLAQESRPEDAEVKSEAAFQRLVASVSELPLQPRTPRAPIDRGRYPEEAGKEEEITREDSPSDDDEPEMNEEGSFVLNLLPAGTQPINIQRPASRTITPAASVAGSFNGDDIGMSMSETSSNFGMAMDIDMPLGSPLLPSLNQWRFTPPPTSSGSAIRSNKRKRSSIDERFDPYPTSSKRRAVSPSISYLRDSHSSSTLNSPITRASGPRLPIALPITMPPSTASSATSSPTISTNYPPFPRGLNITSSPTLRATLTMASPILRPLGSRRRLGEDVEEEREIQGAGEAVNCLTLESTLEPASTASTLEPPAPLTTTGK